MNNCDGNSENVIDIKSKQLFNQRKQAKEAFDRHNLIIKPNGRIERKNKPKKEYKIISRIEQ